MTGNTLPRLQMSDIVRLPVVVPPLPVQETICTKINKLQMGARRLRRQANEELEKAKREIENIILGREDVQ